MIGEYPNLPFHTPGVPYPLDDAFEPGMVFCVESYIGSPTSGQGVKLEDQLLITDTGIEIMNDYPFEERLPSVAGRCGSRLASAGAPAICVMNGVG
jgi:Xaa-Pro aminopeptidase